MFSGNFPNNDIKNLLGRALAISLMSLMAAGLVNALRPEPLAWNWDPPSPIVAIIDNLGDFKALLEKPETVLVDARDEFFYQMGHIPGAFSFPAGETGEETLAAWRESLSPDAGVIIYCSDPFCSMAEDLGKKMMAVGLSPTVFSPGFEAWEEAGLPVKAEER